MNPSIHKYLMDRRLCHSKKSNSVPESKIVNLEDIVLEYAREWFNDNEKKDIKKVFGWKYGKWDRLIKEIDWSNFRATHSDASENADNKQSNNNIQKRLSQRSLGSYPIHKRQHILFRSKFINDTEKEQSYNLNTERRTTSKCKISLQSGYRTSNDSHVSLRIPLPNFMLKSTANLKSEYCLSGKTEMDIEEELRWSADSIVKIPGMCSTTAELIVEEDEYKGDFTIRSVFNGHIHVYLRRPKDSTNIVQMNFSDLSDIFTSKYGFVPVPEQNSVSRISKGTFSIQSAINQRVELHQSKLR